MRKQKWNATAPSESHNRPLLHGRGHARGLSSKVARQRMPTASTKHLPSEPRRGSKGTPSRGRWFRLCAYNGSLNGVVLSLHPESRQVLLIGSGTGCSSASPKCQSRPVSSSTFFQSTSQPVSSRRHSDVDTVFPQSFTVPWRAPVSSWSRGHRTRCQVLLIAFSAQWFHGCQVPSSGRQDCRILHQRNP